LQALTVDGVARQPFHQRNLAGWRITRRPRKIAAARDQ
jgi:hypothetical protein